jgi:hypothetical protein
VLYRIEIARDGAFIKLAGAEDVKYGNIRVPETITELTAGGENGQFTHKLKDGVATLPVGKYRIEHWEVNRKDDKGKTWTMRGYSFSDRGDFEIKEDTETALEIGEPITASLQVQSSGENYEFSKNLRGSLGEYVRLTSSGQDIGNLWKMKVRNKDGTFEKIYPIPDQ